MIGIKRKRDGSETNAGKKRRYKKEQKKKA